MVHISTLSMLSFLIPISHALPYNALAALPKAPLQRRLAYSVVAVDGGAAAAAASSTPMAPGATTTVVSVSVSVSDEITTVTATPAPSIEMFTTTISESGAPTTIKMPTTKTTTGASKPKIEIVNAEEPNATTSPTAAPSTTTFPAPTTVQQTIDVAPIPSSSSSSASSSISSTTSYSSFPSFSISSTSLIVVPSAAANQPLDPIATPQWPKAAERVQPSISLSSSTTAATPTTSPKSYDNGKWHTSYRAWNATSIVTGNPNQAAEATGAWMKG